MEFNEFKCYDEFKGLIKLKKDPKPEQITIHNIIKEQAIIKSKWVLGVILPSSDKRFTFVDSLYDKSKLKQNLRFLLNLVSIFSLFVMLVYFILISNISKKET